ncbi:MAG: hypothetical protein MUF19_02755 [Candidatus Pacebacteria bacterium]|jgi:pimeloyl-ACP methyl ester carboxylesterase|nr:hypothetical protein [Candidatus Paceibacterota bacterium]
MKPLALNSFIHSSFLLALLAAFFVPIFIVHAQTTCGEIIIPADNFNGTPEERTPVTNCDNPFETTTDVDNPYAVIIEGNPVTPGGTVLVPEGQANSYEVDGEPYLTGFDVEYYRHEGANYEQVRTNFNEVPRDRLLAYAETYFSETVLPLYQEIIMSDFPDDYYFDENGEFILDSEGEAIAQRYEDFLFDATYRIQVPLFAGTYTAVITEYLLELSHRSIWDKLREALVPTAHANHDSTWPPRYVFAITFTISAEESVPQGASSVLFLPGIQASLLETNGDQLWTPTRNQDVEQLAMTPNGNSVNDVYTTGIMAKIPLGQTVYQSFGSYMVELVQNGVISGWTPFAYDWRYSVNDIANVGTKYEEGIRDAVDEIEYLAANSFTGKVTIIGHSNGGLLAKVIMKRLESEGKSNLVDKIVLLASPQLGTPKAIGTILHGFDQEKLGGWLIDDVTARDVIQNMPGAYGLVTSEKYLSSAPDNVIHFDTSTATEMFKSKYGATIDSINELERFMIGVDDDRLQASTIDEVLNVNVTMLSNELALHRDDLDSWIAPDGVEIIEVVGTGLDTVSGFEYRGFTERVCTLGIFGCQIKDLYKPVPIISQNGDKTVMSLSAQAYEGDKQLYFVDLESSDIKGGNFKVEHFNISENPSVQKLLKNILLATTSEIEFISQTPDINSEERIMFGVHSPVDIELVGSGGKRVGKQIIDGSVTKEESIPNSSYFEIGTSKYIIVPKNDTYEIKVTGISEGGLTFTQDRLVGDTQTKQYAVAVATITASTTIDLSFDDDLSNLEIDINGDGDIDQVLSPLGADVTPKITYQTLKDKITSSSLSRARKLPLLVLVETAEQLDKKSVTNPRLVLLEMVVIKQIEVLLATYQKKRWISNTNYEELLFIVNKLK